MTIVIPQRGHSGLTIQCVQSLRCAEGDDAPIIVIDDGSGDESSLQVLQAELPNCRIVEQSPLGVTAAWNNGLRQVETANALLLNNDVFVGGRFLDQLVLPLQNQQAQLVGTEWRSEPHIPIGLGEKLHSNRLLAGWCLAFSVDLWRELDGFDESLATYFSDTDFQCRLVQRSTSDADVQRIRPLHSVGPLPLRHLRHQTTRRDPRRSLQWQQDRTTFLRKWADNVGCCKSATWDGLSAAQQPVPGR